MTHTVKIAKEFNIKFNEKEVLTKVEQAAQLYYRTQISHYVGDIDNIGAMYDECVEISKLLFENNFDKTELINDNLGKDFVDCVNSFVSDFDTFEEAFEEDNQDDFTEHLTQWCQIED